MSMPITKHFTVGEFASHDGEQYPAQWIQERLLPLCQLLEVVRSACGDKAITITSGYRSPVHNLAIGGAAHSQHMLGRAADIEVNGLAPSDVHAVVLQLFEVGKLPGLGALGIYPAWNHLDIRPWIGHLAQWTGAGIGSERAA